MFYLCVCMYVLTYVLYLSLLFFVLPLFCVLNLIFLVTYVRIVDLCQSRNLCIYVHHSIKMQISNAVGSPCMYLHTCYAYSCVLIQYKLSFLRHTHVLVIPHSGVIVYIISSYVRAYVRTCDTKCSVTPAQPYALSCPCVIISYIHTVHTVNLYLSTVCHIRIL